jgi:hypothetical protein
MAAASSFLSPFPSFSSFFSPFVPFIAPAAAATAASLAAPLAASFAAPLAVPASAAGGCAQLRLLPLLLLLLLLRLLLLPPMCLENILRVLLLLLLLLLLLCNIRAQVVLLLLHLPHAVAVPLLWLVRQRQRRLRWGTVVGGGGRTRIPFQAGPHRGDVHTCLPAVRVVAAVARRTCDLLQALGNVPARAVVAVAAQL